MKKSIGESHNINISSVDFSIARKMCQASELFVAIFGGVAAMKKGGKKYIIYVVSNSYVNSNFYLKVVCKHKCERVVPERLGDPGQALPSNDGASN